jgi:hypothetical protein
LGEPGCGPGQPLVRYEYGNAPMCRPAAKDQSVGHAQAYVGGAIACHDLRDVLVDWRDVIEGSLPKVAGHPLLWAFGVWRRFEALPR